MSVVLGSVCSSRKGQRQPEGGERRGDSSQRWFQRRRPFQDAKLAEAYLDFKERCVHLKGRECIYSVKCSKGCREVGWGSSFSPSNRDTLNVIIVLDFCLSGPALTRL